jgi:protein-S-isoprenylcysteine O-methyltransferase Ste14
MSDWHVIRALWLIWLLFWLVSAIGTKRTMRRESNWTVMLLLVVGLYAVFARVGGPLRHHLVPSAAWIAPTSVILCAIGLGFSIWARVVLGRNWSSTPAIKEGHELIQTGPYRLVRHPIYTGLLLASFATCLYSHRVMDAIIFAAVLLALIPKMRTEESLMLEQFPEAYAEYKEHTKALIPFIL